MESLQKRRKDNKIILLYKGLNGRAKIPTDDLIHKNRRFRNGSVSASGTGRIRLESPRPAMPDTEPILTEMAPCPALHFSYKFTGSK